MQQIQERRYLDRPELRTVGEKTLTGCAVKYNVLSADLGGFRERIAPGAFTASLASGRDVKLLREHDPSLLIGSVAGGSLITDDRRDGLYFTCKVNLDTTVGQDAWSMVHGRDVREMSVCFSGAVDSWTREADPDNPNRQIDVRTVTRATLWEFSVVCFPAYDRGTSVAAAAARSLFPGGAIPLEIRSRFPEITLDPIDPAWEARVRSMLHRAGMTL